MLKLQKRPYEHGQSSQYLNFYNNNFLSKQEYRWGENNLHVKSLILKTM